jgi:hypothetical protein
MTNSIPTDSNEEIPDLLAAAHIETIKAVKEVSGNVKHCIHKKCKERHSRCNDGYSPSARIIQDALQRMIEIQRKAFTRNTHRRWTHETFQSIICPLASRWQLFRVRECFPDVDVFRLGLGLSCPSELIHAPSSSLAQTKLDDSIRALRSLIHGRKRHDMRIRMNARVAEIEKLRLDNKLVKVIRLLGDNEYTTIDFSTIREEDGRTRTTPTEVSKVLEKYLDG